MRKLTIIFCILAFLAPELHSQERKDSVYLLETVEVTALRGFEKEKAGMKESRVDSLVLLKNINASLFDLLSENSPVFIKEEGRGAMATASFRGTAASHTQVNWNGVPINSPMTGMVDFSLIPVYLADDIGLAYGPASIASGSGGIGGSVNISNRAGWEDGLNLKYIQGIGSYKTFEEFLEFGAGNESFRSKTRLYHNYSKNDYPFINRGIATIDPESGEITNPEDKNKNADYSLYGILQEFYLKAGANNTLSARYWFQGSERTIPRATTYEGPDHSNLNRQQNTDHRLHAEWKNFGEKYYLSIRSAYTFKDLDYSLKNFVSGLGEEPAIYSESRINSFLNKATYHLDLRDDFSLEMAIDADYHRVDTRDSVKKTGYQKDRAEYSFFAAAGKSFFGRLNLNLMLRQDIVDGKAVPLVPYFGFDLQVSREEKWFVRGNIARIFHRPALNDLYWQPGGNPDLEPEQGYSTELGTDYRLEYGRHSLKLGLTGYFSEINDWIIWVPSYKGFWEPGNISRVESKGLEAELGLEGAFGKFRYTVLANYAYTSSKNYGDPEVWGDESYGKQLVYVPLHSGNLMLNLSFKGYYITWQHNSYSERFTTSSNDISRRDWLYPYYMNDLMFGKSFSLGKVEIGAEFRIYNLFNETYHTVLYRPMPGRNYMLMLMFRI